MKKLIAAMFAVFAVPLILTGCSGKSGGEVTDTKQSTLFEGTTESATVEATDEAPASVPESTVNGDDASVVPAEPETENDDKNTNLSQAFSQAASDVKEAISDNLND